jgi:N-acetylglutamate synthase-like GNAT family acetyltransferase
VSGQAAAGAAPQLLPVDLDDLADLARVLDQAGLPSDDVRLPGRYFFRAANEGRPVGFGGLEGNGPDLLLRSVVVQSDARGQGHGAAIVRLLEERAGVLGAARLHLLTTTAADFFLRLGYQPAARETSPASIAGTAQFASLCPASARYLAKTLPRA